MAFKLRFGCNNGSYRSFMLESPLVNSFNNVAFADNISYTLIS